MAKDLYGRTLKKGQTIVLKNAECIPYEILDVVTMTRLTAQGPIEVTTLKVGAVIDIAIVNSGAPMQGFIVKEPETEQKRLVDA
jgi:hypothetical protein